MGNCPFSFVDCLFWSLVPFAPLRFLCVSFTSGSASWFFWFLESIAESLSLKAICTSSSISSDHQDCYAKKIFSECASRILFPRLKQLLYPENRFSAKAQKKMAATQDSGARAERVFNHHTVTSLPVSSSSSSSSIENTPCTEEFRTLVYCWLLFDVLLFLAFASARPLSESLLPLRLNMFPTVMFWIYCRTTVATMFYCCNLPVMTINYHSLLNSAASETRTTPRSCPLILMVSKAWLRMMDPLCLQIPLYSPAVPTCNTCHTQHTHVTHWPMKKSSETFTQRMEAFSVFSLFRSSDWLIGRSVGQPVVMVRWPWWILQREDQRWKMKDETSKAESSSAEL